MPDETHTPDAGATQPTIPGVVAPPAEPPAKPVPPPPVRAAGRSKKAEAVIETEIPAIVPEVEAAVLARLGIGSADDLDDYRAYRRAQEESKPDVKLAKDNERLTRAAATATQEAEKHRRRAEELEASVKRMEGEHAEREFSLWLDGFAGSLATHAGLVPEAIEDLRDYLDRRFRAEGEGTERKMVFADGTVKLAAGADAAELRSKIAEHIVKARPHWIGSRARPGSGAAHGLPASLPAPTAQPGAVPTRRSSHEVLAARLIADRTNGKPYGRRI